MTEITDIPHHHESLSDDALRALYTNMVRFRRFEEAAARAYGMGQIHGFCHLHIGQEAISAAIAAVHQEHDIVIGGYRTHTISLATGVTEEEAMCELFGKENGMNQGLGGSMHMYKPSTGFYGGWGLVGQQLPAANGLAFGQKYTESPGATLCLIGDGAVHQGAVHESLNLASIWGLPLVVLIENNQYGMGTAVDRISSFESLHALAEPYDIEHWEFDGMDVRKTYDSLFEAMKRSREDSRPRFIEAVCSRFRGHSMSDPGKYRTKKQLKEEKGRDPIPHFGNQLVDDDVLTKEDIKSIDDEQKKKMKEVIETADNSEFSAPDILERYVFAQSPEDDHE